MPMWIGLARLAMSALTALAISCGQAAARDDFSARDLPRASYFFQTEEGAEGETFHGTVEWSKYGAPVPAIRALIRLPEKDAMVFLKIFPNNPGDSAPYIITIAVVGDLAASPIRRIPGIVGKARENFSGDMLAACVFAWPRRDQRHSFWFVLSGKDQETETKNLQLLRYGAWFDVPILFRDGSRALLTIERGEAGAEVFDAVLQAWQGS